MQCETKRELVMTQTVSSGSECSQSVIERNGTENTGARKSIFFLSSLLMKPAVILGTTFLKIKLSYCRSSIFI